MKNEFEIELLLLNFIGISPSKLFYITGGVDDDFFNIQNDVEKIIECYLKLRDLHSEDANYWWILGHHYLMTKKDWDNATFSPSLKIEPVAQASRSYDYHCNQGRQDDCLSYRKVSTLLIFGRLIISLFPKGISFSDLSIGTPCALPLGNRMAVG